jgi:hypothetical protein
MEKVRPQSGREAGLGRGLVASHFPVLLATYTPSMEISVSREGIPGTAKVVIWVNEG